MRAEIFVALLGASNYTYAEALPSQALPHWDRFSRAHLPVWGDWTWHGP